MTNEELEELQSIKKLVMLLLFKMDATQDEVATALGITQARVSQLLPTKSIKPAKVESIKTN
jgi:DNA-directed RNA polymerase specialized sigma subunit